MTAYSLSDAQRHLEALVAEAMQGKTILIQGADDKIVQLVPLASSNKPRRAGSARGQIVMASDFDAPLEDFGDYME